jgi:putative MATE family efflux protein
MYNLVDTAYIGRLGAPQLAALTFSFPLFFTLVSFNIGMGVGLNSLVSRRLGAGDEKAAANAALHGVVASLACAGLLFLLTEIFLGPLFSLLGAEGEVKRLACEYMRIIAGGVFMMFPMYAINSTFAAQGDTLTPMKVQFFTLFLNLTLDPIFIFGFGLGIRGAAIATNLALMAGLFTAARFLKKRSRLRLVRANWHFSAAIVRETFAIGLPASLTMLLMAFYMMGINRLVAGYGTNTVAALGLITRLDSAVIIPMVALAIALLTLAGTLYGAGEFKLLYRIIRFTVCVNIGFACACGLLMFLLPELFLRLFTNQPEPLALAVGYLRLEVFSYPFIAVTITSIRALQGLGRSLPGLAINLTRLFLVSLPLAALFTLVLHTDFRFVALAALAGNLAAAGGGFAWLMKILQKVETAPGH